MKEKYNNLSYDSFIGGWFIDNKIVDDLLYLTQSNLNVANPGTIGNKLVDKNIKDSLDLNISPEDSNEPFLSYRKALQLCLEDYIKDYPMLNECVKFNICTGYNIQHYPVGGGFKIWHFENAGEIQTFHRHLVFMTFLNDVEDGGTEFIYQKIKIPARKGLTLIWPAHWTHTHRGIISNSSEKTIITGWYSFVDIFNKIKN